MSSVSSCRADEPLRDTADARVIHASLWNLLPADAAVNGRKSDRLPERRFLLGRRSAVVSCWDLARTHSPQRFEREAAGLAGVTRPSLDVLFDAMVEAVAVTALQRGAELWAP